MRLPLNSNVFCDVDFPVNITHVEFFDCVFANMALDRTTAELGWRFNDEPKHGPVHRLANNDSDDLHGAFHALLGKQNQPRRRQEVFMEIIHIVCFASIIRQLANNVYRTLHRLVSKRMAMGRLTAYIALSCASLRRNCSAIYKRALIDGATCPRESQMNILSLATRRSICGPGL